MKLKKDKELLVVGYVILLSFFASSIEADEIVHKFKSPSFSGIGQSSHYLTIENQEKSRRDKIAQDIRDQIAKAEREAQNTTLAKFLRNVESRIYAQIAKQLVENMFSNGEAASFGMFTIEGNTVTYEKLVGEDGAEFIRLTIVSSDGTTTTLDIPVGTGSF
jgi:CO dehydrogenase/acetyl-CoA synthase beta subunit